MTPCPGVTVPKDSGVFLWWTTFGSSPNWVPPTLASKNQMTLESAFGIWGASKSFSLGKCPAQQHGTDICIWVGGKPHMVQQGPGSAFTADRKRHICDLFLVLTRIPCMKSSKFPFLFLKMKLMIVLGSPIQRRGNFINACKILQKTAWGWARVI